VTELTFRHAASEDIPAVVDLVQSAYRGDRSRAGWTTEADLVDGQRIDASMLVDLLERPRTIVLLAESDRLVGCCELSAEHDPDLAYFGMFAVRPELQGAGIGDQILRAAQQTAIDLGCIHHATGDDPSAQRGHRLVRTQRLHRDRRHPSIPLWRRTIRPTKTR
jgi:N-acetylglutamate synthase-like GNAT family acetyltransferase